ncbi:battenin CLN3 protein [Leucoagaricus gongylophorus]
MRHILTTSAGGHEPHMENNRLSNEETSDTTDISRQKSQGHRLLRNLAISFFLFGLFNNVLYVIILSAALDLVPPSTPKGIIAFFNIVPSFVAKVGWPYILKGQIRYAKRLICCCILSMIGMIVVALLEPLPMRLFGIGLASFSSGLGELTFLQLSTTYVPPSVGGHGVGYFASGTGAAGLIGAFLWWELRKLGIQLGIGLSSVMPLAIPLTYFFFLPPNKAFLFSHHPASYEVPTSSSEAVSGLLYTSLATNEEEVREEEDALTSLPKRKVALSLDDKWRLVKPLLTKYMLPLFLVYLFEYTINQGISPTLLYPVPSPDKHWLLGKIIHSIKDYYPFWQLVYQATVFLSRSSISFGLPVLPARLLPLPAIMQTIIFSLLFIESAHGFFPIDSEAISISFVFTLISIEGICGGLAYVNVFYQLNQENSDSDLNQDLERVKQEKEFKIGSIGFADSLGILLASILAMPTEVELCRAQIHRGKSLCEGL